MANLSLGGLISGVNTDGIVAKLLELQNKRISKEQAKRTALDVKQEAWRQVKSSLETLRSKLDGIRLSSAYRGRTAKLSDAAVADVTSVAGASLATHNLEVTRLAQTHVVASANQVSANSALGVTGSLKVNGKAIALSANDTLNSLRDKITATSDVGVTADVVKVMQGATSFYRLSLTSQSSGAAGAVTVTSDLISSNSAMVTPTGATATGSWSVQVVQLAQARAVRSDWAAGNHTGSFQINGNTINVNGDVASIATAINNAAIGITAATETDGAGNTRLTLTTNATGAAATIAFNDDPDGILQSLGLANADLSVKNSVTAGQDAQYRIDGGALQTSSSNSVTDAAGVAGLHLTLAGTGTATVQTLAHSLGFKNAANAWTNQLSAGQDADFRLNNVDYQTSSNVIADVLPNMTITLKKGGTTSITVEKDTEKLAGLVSDWATAVNGSLTLLGGLTRYDAQTKEKGILNGDSLARDLMTSLRRVVSNEVPGLPSTLNRLSQVGITTGAFGTADFGKLLVDKEKLKAQLIADEDGVARVFGALRKNVAAAAHGATIDTDETSATAAGDFAAADVLNGDTDSSRFGSPGGGWQSANPPSTAAQKLTVRFDAETTVDQIMLYLPNSGSYVQAASGLKDFTLEYQATDNSWKTIASVTNHLGASKGFDFTAVSAKAVRLNVTATYGTNEPARVTDLQVNQSSTGAALEMFRAVTGALTSTTGPIATRDSGLTTQIREIDKQIEKLADRLSQQETRLRDQFSRMERSLSKLQGQGAQLLGQLGAMNNSR